MENIDLNDTEEVLALKMALAAHEAFVIEKGLDSEFSRFMESMVKEFFKQKRKGKFTLVK